MIIEKAIKRFVFIIALLHACFANATYIKTTSLTVKDGLPGNTVVGIFQDSRGFIWFATQGNGLARYDGKQIKTYTISDGLPFNDLIAIAEDKQGNIWVSTVDNGVSCFDGKNFKNYSSKNGLAGNRVMSMLCDESGVMWFAADVDGLSSFDGKKFTSYLNKGKEKTQVLSLAKSMKGDLWLGTSKGVYKKKGDSFISFGNKIKLNTVVFSLFVDESDNLYVGSADQEAGFWNGKEFISYNMPKACKGSVIGGIVKDFYGTVWMATDVGLVKVVANKATLLTPENGIKTHSLYTIYKDLSGAIWLGSVENGAIRMEQNLVDLYKQPGNEVSGLTFASCDNKNKLVVGFTNKIYRLSNNQLVKVELLGIDEHVVYNKMLADENQLVIGANDRLIIAKPITENKYNVIKTISHPGTNTNICKGFIENTYFIGSYGSGVSFVNIKTGFNELLHPGIIGNDVTSVTKSGDKIIVGTYSNGIFVLDDQNKMIKQLNTKTGFVTNSIWELITLNGRLFVGTTQNGLIMLDNKFNVQPLLLPSELTSAYIYNLETDHLNSLFITTTMGIYKIDLSDNFKTTSSSLFSVPEGVDGAEIAPKAISFNKERGTLFFGVSTGVAELNYVKPRNKIKPLMRLKSVKLYGQSLDYNEATLEKSVWFDVPQNSPIFNYKQNQLTFEFDALSNYYPLEFSFKIEGLDKDWSVPSTIRTVSYNNLADNKYTFKVRSRLVNTNEWLAEQSFDFTITPPFYKTWWFITLCILSGAASVYFFIRYRTAKLEKEKEILEGKVEQRTYELKESNSKLEEAYTDIKDSIHYAQRIQQAILPVSEQIKKAFNDSFVLFKPRDVVSGDFYWFAEVQKEDGIYKIIAAADCTGHGVPGAFMSMVGNTILNEIVTAKKITNPGRILELLHQGIRKALKQGENESRDGMDIAMCCITPGKKLLYSGANRPLYIISQDSIEEIKATKSAIGGFTEDSQVFEEHLIVIQSNVHFYMTSDGYADQFGGPEGRKLMTKNLKQLFRDIYPLPFTEQYSVLNKTIIDWMGSNHQQVDDILVVGFKSDGS